MDEVLEQSLQYSSHTAIFCHGILKSSAYLQQRKKIGLELQLGEREEENGRK